MKPSLPQGTRDFNAEVLQKRNYLLQSIRQVFELYAFQPLETPAMENLQTLTGKYGDEGDQLIYKILNNGLSDPKNKEKAERGFKEVIEGKNSTDLTERALKYDLTIPFARYLAMNQGQLTFPFKRYQIQNVWRADRPQKGRYREFTQCDVDVAGSASLWNEVELVNIYHDVFTRLKLNDYTLKINNRKILAALAEACGGAEKMLDLSIAIDKLDKIGLEKVKEELQQKSFNIEAINIVESYLQITGTGLEKIENLQKLLPASALLETGIKELQFVWDAATNVNLLVDFTLARGLNYYTGIILEAKAPDSVKMGSIGGGGRYDDLTGLFGLKNITGVGVSFGVDRMYDVLEELNLFPKDLQTGATALFFNMGEAEAGKAFEIMQALRKESISCELYHEPVKLDKQFKYAEKKNIPFVIIIGSQEIEQKAALVKELKTGSQQKVAFNNLSTLFKQTN